MRHNSFSYIISLAFAILLSVLTDSRAYSQNYWCRANEISWSRGSTDTKQFTIRSQDSLAFIVNASACHHFYVQTDERNYTVTIIPFSINNAQVDIVQNLYVTIDDYGTPVTETVVLRHCAAPASPDPDPGPEPEPDPWDALTVDLPDTLSWIQRATVMSADGSSYYRDVTFYDGLGYPSQEVFVGASPGGLKSIYTPIVYDNMRRADVRTYLPYAAATAAEIHDSLAITRQASFYASFPYQDTRPYTEKAYETSPVGRPLSALREGKAWHGGGGNDSHRSTFSYRTNTEDDAVPRYRITPGSTVASYAGVWPESTLHCAEAVDEALDTVRTWTDAFGKTVCTESGTWNRLGTSYEKARTLYIYDIRDSLAMVVQPEGVKALSTKPAGERDLSFSLGSNTHNGDITDQHCFFWTYDGRGNVLTEHTPGAGLVKYAYDARNRQVLKTDSRTSPPGQPNYRMVRTIYDQYDRVIGESLVRSNVPIEVLRSFASAGTTSDLPSSVTSQFMSQTPLKAAEYFPFTWVSAGYPSSGDGAFTPDPGIAETTDLEKARIRGLLRWETLYPAPAVGGTVPAGTPSVTRYYHYDSKGRVIQIKEFWSDGWSTRRSTKYDFVGNVLAEKEVHESSGGRCDSLVTEYGYDERGRRISLCRSLDGDVLRPVYYVYDELGRLSRKTIGDGPDYVGNVTFTYDLHGWTKEIEVETGWDDETVFSETLSYADTLKDPYACRFDGNISGTAFTHRILTDGNGQPDSYLQTNTWSYAYDGLKRLTDANHYPGATLTPSLTDTERDIAYDLNGNITFLKRYGNTGLENDLSFNHDGNRMTALSDANAMGTDAGTKSFTYDANGNMTSDGRKGLELTWNVLNLVDSAAMHGSSLKYAWLSDGTLASVKADDGTGNGVQKRYMGSFVYTSDTGSSADEPTEVESIAWDEGRILMNLPTVVDTVAVIDIPEGGEQAIVDTVAVDSAAVTGLYRDCLYAVDHLGNVRAVIDITSGLPTPQILEQNDYLPFGTRIQNPALVSRMDNRWQYAGKEAQRFGPAGAFSPMLQIGAAAADLGLLDFGARMYDPFTARWTAVDPLAKRYPQHSTRAYCGNNPINTIDAFGDSLAVLNLGGTIGHSALLIQNESGKWEYYSMNGDTYYRFTKGRIGGKGYHDTGEKAFDSVESFLSSSYNQDGTAEQVERNEVNNYGFSEAYVIPTTSEQDRQAERTFLNETEKAYSLLFHNCSIVAGKALLSSGVKTGPSNLKPQSLFDSVIKNNVGTFIIWKQ